MRREHTGDVDFEITFSALLATLAIYLSIPSVSHEWIIEFAAISLLFLTLIRRIAYMNKLPQTHQFFTASSQIMSGISYIVCFYILFWISSKTPVITEIYSQISVFSIIVLPLVLGSVIIQEITIGGFMKESQNVFKSVSIQHQGSLGNVFWQKFTSSSRQARTDQNITTRQSHLSEYKKTKDWDEVTFEEKKFIISHIAGTIFGFLLPFIIYGGLSIILASSLNISILLSFWVIICFHIITFPIDIWFSGYGLVPLENSSWLMKSVITTIGIVFCFYIFPMN